MSVSNAQKVAIYKKKIRLFDNFHRGILFLRRAKIIPFHNRLPAKIFFILLQMEKDRVEALKPRAKWLYHGRFIRFDSKKHLPENAFESAFQTFME